VRDYLIGGVTGRFGASLDEVPAREGTSSPMPGKLALQRKPAGS
jgi:hypothetical protein